MLLLSTLYEPLRKQLISVLDKAPLALSHDGNGQEAALTRLR